MTASVDRCIVSGMSTRKSSAARVDVVYERQPYVVVASGRTAVGDKVRVERWDDGSVHGWNASEGRPATEAEVSEVMV